LNVWNASLKKYEATEILQKWTRLNLGEEMQYRALCKRTAGIRWSARMQGDIHSGCPE
jgi:hypothetical protein